MTTKNPIPSALIVPLPVADRVVDPWRRRLDPAHAQGVQAHVTLQYPFLPAEALDAEIAKQLSELFSDLPRPTVHLTELRVRDSLVYLHPEATVRGAEGMAGQDWFALAQGRLRACWPHLRPYDGKYGDDPPPHLSIAYHRPPGPDPRDLIDEIRAEVEPLLPLVGEADHVLLSVLHEGRWKPFRRLGLAP